MAVAARDWATGYYQQAMADRNAARVLQGGEPSVIAMLLQMIMEKLGKAALLRSGGMTVERAGSTHAAASAMMQQLGRKPRACERLGYKPGIVQYDLAPLVQRLEQSQPALARGGPHLEYPWEALTGEIQWPARHLEVARAVRATSSHGLRLFAFVDQLCDRFDQVFP